ncbi:MAG TPA: hypothetical protein QGF08_01185 [Candidatus Marinimicrobia bacterium]|nr:hypothetical protein [Candidatus Neomarinimicrobiota bacterium]MDP6034026.1 hypothetical protein [Candidatus Neomarinimicrobiota bacterium]MDP6276029.1 hypothetical protein [Candidatus Neomarinimicrobiota bacterium]MDP7329920.1 hypothetical protein [Candidatus Neomarinimicrobiota bacterium]MDP7437735.1 hypothetical protein [Candidatus Neomarinimicrobiota bacterium]
MKKHPLYIIISSVFILVVTATPAFGQFKADVPHQNVRESITGGPTIPGLLDAQNFQMNHSFSMSMMNMGGMSVGVGAYTNAFSMAITPRLSLNTQISLVQPTLNGYQNQGNVFYGVGLNYKATENSYFSFQLNNYPTYYQRPNQYLHLRGY